ncbi:MAG: DEAD/DEAH box helicase, partial [Caulobacterales bacterium]
MSDSSPSLAALLAAARMPKGARKETAELIAKVAGGPLARDLVLLPPHSAIDRGHIVPISETQDGEIATIEAEVDAHTPAFRKLPYRVRLRDETGFISAAYFRAQTDMMKRMWPIGQVRLVSGKVGFYDGERQMLHPDYVVDPSRGEKPPEIEPIYPLTAGLPGRILQRAVQIALDGVPDMPEWLEPTTVSAHKWPAFKDALMHIHKPENIDDVAPANTYRTRLAYDELFSRQCALRLRRAVRRDEPGRSVIGNGSLSRKILASLPYAATGAQQRAVADIEKDMAQPAPMLRLLQGDVGAGKTAVAMLALLAAVENGLQGAMMAPTELLARQHMASLAGMAAAAGIKMALLTGRERG